MNSYKTKIIIYNIILILTISALGGRSVRKAALDNF